MRNMTQNMPEKLLKTYKKKLVTNTQSPGSDFKSNNPIFTQIANKKMPDLLPFGSVGKVFSFGA